MKSRIGSPRPSDLPQLKMARSLELKGKARIRSGLDCKMSSGGLTISSRRFGGTSLRD